MELGNAGFQNDRLASRKLTEIVIANFSMAYIYGTLRYNKLYILNYNSIWFRVGTSASETRVRESHNWDSSNNANHCIQLTK